MPYVPLLQPDKEFLWIDGDSMAPLLSFVSDRDPCIRAHIIREEGVFVLVHNEEGPYFRSVRWFPEAAVAVANLVVNQPAEPPPQSDFVPPLPGSMVYLTGVNPDKRIHTIKAVRFIKEGPLREAKQDVDGVLQGRRLYLGINPPVEWLEYLHKWGNRTEYVQPPTVWEHLDDND